MQDAIDFRAPPDFRHVVHEEAIGFKIDEILYQWWQGKGKEGKGKGKTRSLCLDFYQCHQPSRRQLLITVFILMLKNNEILKLILKNSICWRIEGVIMNKTDIDPDLEGVNIKMVILTVNLLKQNKTNGYEEK